MKITGNQALTLRKKLGENQVTFWSPLGVTQSSGSQYEGGRDIPVPVQRLYWMLYARESNLTQQDMKKLASIGK